ncbi:hypothetical protein [Persicobacter psychrovividus]|uniref:Uncharacterized protein n=1 Tax=Persicobacter psychrovividus TaxID=387638 RepID=A0ABM7VN69_9BACT|nr:hypothetical protein PEPS_47400 [Persicobacter psychrovividus]
MTLNINNYKDQVKKIDFSKMPQAIQEAHEQFDDFAEFYKENDQIKQMLDNHFKLVVKHTSSKTGEKKTSTTRTTAKRTTKKAPAKKASPRARKTAAKATTRKTTTTKTARKTTAKKTTTRKARPPKAAVRKPNEVSAMPMEIRLIRRYKNLHNKKVTIKQVILLYKAIQRAAIEKTIRKSSPYAAIIMSIAKELNDTYKEAKSDGFTFEIPEKLYKKIDELVASYGISAAVSLVKRFIGLYHTITEEKAKRLLKSIENSLKNQKVKKGDYGFAQVMKVQKILKDYLKQDQLILKETELAGLQKVCGRGK